MADRYWVGGTGSWDGTAGTKWATTSGAAGGASVPTTSDDVFFDANSGANTVTIDTGNTGCKSMTCTGFTGTLASSASLTIAGGFTLVAGMTCTATHNWVITGSGTLISAGKTIPFLQINGTGITVDQGDNFTFNSTPGLNIGIIRLLQGTYNTNNYNLSWTSSNNTGGGISVSGSNTRAMNLGSSTITITYIAASQNNIPVFDATNISNLTFNAGTSTYKVISSRTTLSSLGGTFVGNGLTFYNVEFTNLATNSVAIAITGANTFNNLTFASRTVDGIGYYTFAANQTINGTLTTSAGTNASMRSFLISDTFGTTRTLTCAATSLTDADFQDITIAGAAAPASGTRIGNCKGNSGITFPAAKTVYWNLAGAQNFNAVGWATLSGGSPASTNFPLAQDTAIFDNTGSVTGTITVNALYNIGNLDMSLRTSAMTLDNATLTYIYGNYLNGTGTTLTGTGIWQFSGRGSQQITGNGRTISQSIWLNSPSGTLTLQDAVTTNRGTSGAVQLINGTLDLNGKTLTIAGGTNGTFLTSAGTKNLTFNGGTLANNGTNNPINNAAPTGFTTTAGTGIGTISLTGATAKTFVGGGSTYNCTINQGGAGALTISGSNTFTNITNTYKSVGATTIRFTSGTTQTFTNFNASGESGRLLTIDTTTAGTQVTLSKSSGVVNVDYLSIRDLNATGGAVWYAGGNSTNVSNNTGWIFSDATATGNFILFFR